MHENDDGVVVAMETVVATVVVVMYENYVALEIERKIKKYFGIVSHRVLTS